MKVAALHAAAAAAISWQRLRENKNLERRDDLQQETIIQAIEVQQPASHTLKTDPFRKMCMFSINLSKMRIYCFWAQCVEVTPI